MAYLLLWGVSSFDGNLVQMEMCDFVWLRVFVALWGFHMPCDNLGSNLCRTCLLVLGSFLGLCLFK